jgi:type IV pilus assembly protein PilO
MAMSFRELPAPIQALIYLGVAVVIVLAGEYVPGSPMQAVRAELESAKAQTHSLQNDVQSLQVFERQSTQLRADIEAMQKELETLKTIVPDEKQADEFIKALSDSARASSVSIRSISAKPIEPKDYFYEVPFEVAVDGQYYQVVEFFTRLSRLSRIINVGDITFWSANPHDGGPAPPPFPLRPGTSVFGTFTAKTYFTGGVQSPNAQAKPGAKR